MWKKLLNQFRSRKGTDGSAHTRVAESRDDTDMLRIADMIFNLPVGVLVADANRVILQVNPAFTAMTGYECADVVGKTPWMLRSGHHDQAFYQKLMSSLAETDQWEGEIWDRHKDGQIVPKWMSISIVRNDDDEIEGFVAIYSDSHVHTDDADMAHESMLHDPLTGLPGRALAQEHLSQAIATTAQTQTTGVAALLNLDGFHRINSSLGFMRGDLLLQQVAKRLERFADRRGVVARVGADEFIVLLTLPREDTVTDCQAASELAKQILDILADDYDLDGQRQRASASLGLTLFSGGESDTAEIIKQTELALRKVKKEGGGGLHFFDVELENRVSYRVLLEQALNHALEQDQLTLYYQPQVDASNYVFGAEALVRWVHPERGMISPGDFIPAAEESGQILELGTWVLKEACRQLAAWRTVPVTANLTLAINVSALQLRQADFVETVREALQEHNIEPQRLKLELTESMLIDNARDILERLRCLRDLGVRLSLDDFGTGYSSLAYLHRMPLDQLKIDLSFVRDMLTDTSTFAVAQTIAMLGHALNLNVIAEGVETCEQRDALLEMGCTAFQGYLFSRPLPAEEFVACIHQGFKDVCMDQAHASSKERQKLAIQ